MQTLKVFVSSPGDVREEREVVGRVVERLEASYWNFVRLDSVLWERELVRATGHFNEEIVRPSDCDVVLSILWRRLGSPMPPQFQRPDGTRYESGTVWEIEEAVAGYEARRLARTEGRTDETPFPDVLIFRRDAPAAAKPLPDAAEQLRKLDAFWRRFMLHPDGTARRAYHRYASLKDFERSVEALLEEAVRARLPRLTATQEVIEPVPLQGSPFKGLAAFEAVDAPLFFGRERSLGEALRQLRAQAEKGCPFLLIYGGSGSGKSSLMKAGLTPRLTRSGWLPGVETWRRAALLPSQGEGSLVENLAHALRAAMPASSGPGRLAEQLAAAPAEAAGAIAAALAVEAGHAGHAAESTRLLLEIDQLEEVFTAPEIDDAGRDAFFAALAALAAGGTWIVATMRSEFFPRVTRHANLLRLVRAGGGYILVPPRPEELARMVRCPTMAAGLGFQRHPQTAQDLSEAILEQAQHNPGALPLLQFCLQRLWEQREEGRVLTWSAYEAMGGLEGAIARTAGDTFARLHAHERAAGRRVFAELVQINDEEASSEAGPVVRRRASLGVAQNAAPGADIFVAAFVGAKLLVTEGTATGATLTLAHEALLTHWPELMFWVQANRRLLAARRRLETAADEWAQAGRDRGLLLRDRRLLDAEEVTGSGLFHLRGEEQSLLAESRRLQHRGRRVRQGVFTGALVLAGAASVAAVLAAQSATRAEKAERVAVEQRDRADAQAKEAQAAARRAVAARAGAEELINFMTFNLRDMLEPIGRLSLMDEVNQKVAAYHRRFAREDDAPELLRRRSVSLGNQADALRAKGDLVGALQFYRDALAIHERLAQQEPGSAKRLRDLSVSYIKIANVLVAKEDLPGAIKAYRDALAIAARLARQDPASAQWQSDLSVIYSNLADALSEQGDLASALSAHREGLAITKRLAQQDPANARWQSDLCVGYRKLANVLSSQGDLSGALEGYREALVIASRLVQKDPANAQWQSDLCVSHLMAGDALRRQGNLVDALQAYRDAQIISARLARQDPANAEWHRDLFISHGKVADVLFEQGDLAGAFQAQSDALAIAERLAQRNPANTLWQRDLAITWEKISSIHLKNREWQKAAEAIQKGLDLARPWLDRPDIDVGWSGIFAVAVSRRWKMLQEGRGQAAGIGRSAALADLRWAVEMQRRLDAAGQLDARGRKNLAMFESQLREAEK